MYSTVYAYFDRVYSIQCCVSVCLCVCCQGEGGSVRGWGDWQLPGGAQLLLVQVSLSLFILSVFVSGALIAAWLSTFQKT